MREDNEAHTNNLDWNLDRNLDWKLDWPRLAAQRKALHREGAAATIGELAQRAAHQTPRSIAFFDADRAVDFARLHQDAQHLAACLCCLVCNPIVPIYRDAELGNILADCRSRVLFVPGTWRGVDYGATAQRVAAQVPTLKHIVSVRSGGALDYESLLSRGAGLSFEAPSVSPDAVKLIMYTSDTTGPA